MLDQLAFKYRLTTIHRGTQCSRKETRSCISQVINILTCCKYPHDSRQQRTASSQKWFLRVVGWRKQTIDPHLLSDPYKLKLTLRSCADAVFVCIYLYEHAECAERLIVSTSGCVFSWTQTKHDVRQRSNSGWGLLGSINALEWLNGGNDRAPCAALIEYYLLNGGNPRSLAIFTKVMWRLCVYRVITNATLHTEYDTHGRHDGSNLRMGKVVDGHERGSLSTYALYEIRFRSTWSTSNRELFATLLHAEMFVRASAGVMVYICVIWNLHIEFVLPLTSARF